MLYEDLLLVGTHFKRKKSQTSMTVAIH